MKLRKIPKDTYIQTNLDFQLITYYRVEVNSKGECGVTVGKLAIALAI